MLEHEIEEVLHRRFKDATGWPLTVLDRQVQLPARRRLDLLARDDQNGVLWAIELKPGQVTPADVGQVLGYLPLLQSSRGLSARPVLMAPRIRADAAARADAAGVMFRQLDVPHLLGLQRELQLRPTAPAYVKGVNVLASLREHRKIADYYADTFPRHRHQVGAATEFTLMVLESLPGAAMAWRAASGWVCLTIPTGDVVASVELKPTGLQLGLGITSDRRAEYEQTRLGRIVNDPRSIGIWVHAQQAEVEARLADALDWYRAGLPAWCELRALPPVPAAASRDSLRSHSGGHLAPVAAGLSQ